MTHRHPCLMQAMARLNERKASAGASADGKPVPIDARLLLMGLEEIDHGELVDAMALVVTTNLAIMGELVVAAGEEGEALDLARLAAQTGTAFVEGLGVGLMLCHLRQEADR